MPPAKLCNSELGFKVLKDLGPRREGHVERNREETGKKDKRAHTTVNARQSGHPRTRDKASIAPRVLEIIAQENDRELAPGFVTSAGSHEARTPDA